MAKRTLAPSLPSDPSGRAGLPQPNPALKNLETLVGVWDMEIANARFLPNPTDTVRGQVSFEWIEDGDFLVMRQGQRAGGSPYAAWLFARDESADEYVALYCDDRRVSRMYRMRFTGGDWQLWREAAGFCQRFKGTVSKDGNTITASWEMSRDEGKTWEHDFDLRYRRRPRLEGPRRSRAPRLRGSRRS
jgi:hypothetical protein